ncbi:alpha/beta hydrolase [Jongsikchunia kroppenstedtii]|uniref:alpha/beta hydrolase n=1 Tax=Jongsikchunia kroppenstedtii TaxID=1121721 RepID=UPI00036F7E64|nr:alpha/beta hydrolase [Jongsikchunia kroppenstedtii]
MPYVPLPVAKAILRPTFGYILNPRRSPRQQRQLLDSLSRTQLLPKGTTHQAITLGGRPTELVQVRGTGSMKTDRGTAILYLHGGGYVNGSPLTHRTLAASLAAESGAALYVLDYRLAPEHPCPAAVDDAVAAYLELVEKHGLRPESIAIAGDSAGGGLSVAAARRLIDKHGIRPAALGLIAPWVDPADTSGNPQADDIVVSLDWGHQCAEFYRGNLSATDPEYAPMHADLTGLPPTVIHVGVQEELYPQVSRFASKLRAADVETEVVTLPRLWHVAHAQATMVAEAADATRRLAQSLAAQLSG